MEISFSWKIAWKGFGLTLGLWLLAAVLAGAGLVLFIISQTRYGVDTLRAAINSLSLLVIAVAATGVLATANERGWKWVRNNSLPRSWFHLTRLFARLIDDQTHYTPHMRWDTFVTAVLATAFLVIEVMVPLDLILLLSMLIILTT